MPAKASSSAPAPDDQRSRSSGPAAPRSAATAAAAAASTEPARSTGSPQPAAASSNPTRGTGKGQGVGLHQMEHDVRYIPARAAGRRPPCRRAEGVEHPGQLGLLAGQGLDDLVHGTDRRAGTKAQNRQGTPLSLR